MAKTAAQEKHKRKSEKAGRKTRGESLMSHLRAGGLINFAPAASALAGVASQIARGGHPEDITGVRARQSVLARKSLRGPLNRAILARGQEMTNEATRAFHARRAILLAWLIACAAFAFSLFFSEVRGWTPCALCWYQRICLWPLIPILATVLVVTAAVAGTPPGPGAKGTSAPVTDGVSAALVNGREIELRVKAVPGDGWISLARRYCGTSSAVRRLKMANPGMAQPLRDRRVSIPMEALRADLRLPAVSESWPASGTPRSFDLDSDSSG